MTGSEDQFGPDARVSFIEMDLAALDSVRSAAAAVLSRVCGLCPSNGPDSPGLRSKQRHGPR